MSGSADSGSPSRRTRRVRSVRVSEIDPDRGVFMISVAAELADMHPQTLRMYEARGLITPKRSPKNTRLYSQEDVERLRRIQAMTAEQGLNLAGVETVLELEDKLERMRSEMARMRLRAEQMERQMVAEIERARRSFGAELVPYGAYESQAFTQAGEDAGPDEREDAVSIPVERTRRSRD